MDAEDTGLAAEAAQEQEPEQPLRGAPTAEEPDTAAAEALKAEAEAAAAPSYEYVYDTTPAHGGEAA